MTERRGLRDRIVSSTVGGIERYTRIRLVRSGEYAALVADRQKLKRELSSYRQTADSEELVRIAAWMRRLERADHKGKRIMEFAAAARHTARLVADHLADLLSLGKVEDDTVGRVQAMLASGSDLTEITRDLARRNALDPGRTRLRPFPADSPDRVRALLGEVSGTFQIVDVGAGAAKRAHRSYAPLAAVYPTAVLALDPTVADGTVSPAPSVVSACSLTILGQRIGAGHGTLDAALAKAGSPATDLLRIDLPDDPMDALAGAGRTLEQALVCQLSAMVSAPHNHFNSLAAIDTVMRGKGLVLAEMAATVHGSQPATDRGPTAPAYPLAADCIYLRRTDPLEKLGKGPLVRLAAIAHTLYRKNDLAAEALTAYDAVTGEHRSAALAALVAGTIAVN